MITKEEVLKLANLSKLSFSDEKIEKLTEDMQSIISFADKINNVAVSVDTVSPNELINVMREDVVTDSLSQEEILKNAINENGHFFIHKRRD